MVTPAALSATFASRSRRLLPGLLFSLAVTALAVIGEHLEVMLFGRAWLEALVLAILIGALWRHLAPPGRAAAPGIAFSGKLLLEVAVVLLGASISGAALAAAGPVFLLAVAGLVLAGIIVGLLLGRALGLGRRVALLVACGTAICGNSAIAAIAPVIGADADEVASSIAFTAVLGVAAVLVLPLLAGPLGLDARQYGVFAGLTVYAVPQVIAATAPVSAISVGAGTLTKLMRVLMLGPAIFGIALASGRGAAVRPRIEHLLPWFIVGFLVMLGLGGFGLIPHPLLAPIGLVANLLTIVAMAALGLSVDLRAVASSGGRVIATATLCLLVLCGLAFFLIRGLGIG